MMIHKEMYYVKKVKNIRFCLCFGCFNHPVTVDRLEEVLSEVEYARYLRLKSEKKKKEVFWSAFLSKYTLQQLYNKPLTPFQDIDLVKGFLHNPVFLEPFSEYCVSISHSNNYIIAAVFPNTIVMGVDIEIYDENKEYTSLWLTNEEKRIKPKDMNISLYSLILWTCKEALGKSIRQGLQVDYNIYSLKSIVKVEGGYISAFSYFHQLAAYTQIKDDVVYTIVLPKSIEIDRVHREEVYSCFIKEL